MSNLVTILLTLMIIIFQSVSKCFKVFLSVDIIDRLFPVLLYSKIIIEGSIYEVPPNNNVPHNVEGKDFENSDCCFNTNLKAQQWKMW